MMRRNQKIIRMLRMNCKNIQPLILSFGRRICLCFEKSHCHMVQNKLDIFHLNRIVKKYGLFVCVFVCLLKENRNCLAEFLSQSWITNVSGRLFLFSNSSSCHSRIAKTAHTSTKHNTIHIFVKGRVALSQTVSHQLQPLPLNEKDTRHVIKVFRTAVGKTN